MRSSLTKSGWGTRSAPHAPCRRPSTRNVRPSSLRLRGSGAARKISPSGKAARSVVSGTAAGATSSAIRRQITGPRWARGSSLVASSTSTRTGVGVARSASQRPRSKRIARKRTRADARAAGTDLRQRLPRATGRNGSLDAASRGRRIRGYPPGVSAACGARRNAPRAASRAAQEPARPESERLRHAAGESYKIAVFYQKLLNPKRDELVVLERSDVRGAGNHQELGIAESPWPSLAKSRAA